MTGPVHSRFSPRTIPGERLERLTVGREDLLERLERDIRDAVRVGQARFDLLLGARGAGKSHTIGVLEHRLAMNAEIRETALVVSLPEEIHPTSLLHMLAQVLRTMPLDDDLGPMDAQIRNLARNPDDGEERAIGMIAARLDGRALILILENLDDLFDAIGRPGQRRLRNVLQTQRNWSVLATARGRVSAFIDHDAPFHGTFNLHALESFSAEDCRKMLARLADASSEDALATEMRSGVGLARIRGIRHVLGGSPRAMAFIYRHLDIHRLDHFETALWDLAEELTPYFQEQMTRLSPTQRAAMEVLSESWSPLSVGEIAERIFCTESSTSSTLRYLLRDGLVAKMKVGRECYYEIADPLHRIARATKQNRLLDQTLGRVVRSWFAQDDIVSFSLRMKRGGALNYKELLPSLSDSQFESDVEAHFIFALARGGLADGRLFLASCSTSESSHSLRIIRRMMDCAENNFENISDLFQDMSDSEELAMRAILWMGHHKKAFKAIPVLHELARTSHQVDEFLKNSTNAPTPVAPSLPQAKTLASMLVWRCHILLFAGNARRFDSVAELLNWLEPPPPLLSIELGLTACCDRAWHFGSMPEIEPALARLLATQARQAPRTGLEVLASSVCGTIEHLDSTSDFYRAPAGPLLEFLARADDLASILGFASEEEATALLLWGAICQVAARRDLELVRELHACIREKWERPLPAWPDDPMEAFARFPEVMRHLVRDRLRLIGDHEGLRFFGLDPAPPT